MSSFPSVLVQGNSLIRYFVALSLSFQMRYPNTWRRWLQCVCKILFNMAVIHCCRTVTVAGALILCKNPQILSPELPWGPSYISPESGLWRIYSVSCFFYEIITLSCGAVPPPSNCLWGQLPPLPPQFLRLCPIAAHHN